LVEKMPKFNDEKVNHMAESARIIHRMNEIHDSESEFLYLMDIISLVVIESLLEVFNDSSE